MRRPQGPPHNIISGSPSHQPPAKDDKAWEIRENPNLPAPPKTRDPSTGAASCWEQPAHGGWRACRASKPFTSKKMETGSREAASPRILSYPKVLRVGFAKDTRHHARRQPSAITVLRLHLQAPSLAKNDGSSGGAVAPPAKGVQHTHKSAESPKLQAERGFGYFFFKHIWISKAATGQRVELVQGGRARQSGVGDPSPSSRVPQVHLWRPSSPRDPPRKGGDGHCQRLQVSRGHGPRAGSRGCWLVLSH